MPTLRFSGFLFSALAVMLGATNVRAEAPKADADGWMTLFDGKSMDGWKVVENADTWKLVDGTLTCKGNRSHLFYVADDKPFVNFEFKADVKAAKGSNSGIYFHTKFQEADWPKFGYECLVNNSMLSEPKKSGSLYGTVDVKEQLIADDTWWTQTITVQGKHIVVKLNDKVVVDYNEPDNQPAFDAKFERRLGSGTFALQGHDPGSVVSFKNIHVRRLP